LCGAFGTPNWPQFHVQQPQAAATANSPTETHCQVVRFPFFSLFLSGPVSKQWRVTLQSRRAPSRFSSGPPQPSLLVFSMPNTLRASPRSTVNQRETSENMKMAEHEAFQKSEWNFFGSVRWRALFSKHAKFSFFNFFGKKSPPISRLYQLSSRGF
jgi:hypothetical protein